MVSRRSALFSLFAVLLFALSLHERARAASPTKTWGFYVTYDPASRQSLLAHLDQLNTVVPSYYQLVGSQTIAGTDDPQLDATIRTAGLGLLPLVGNRDRYAALSSTLDDPTRRAEAIAAIVALPDRYAYDGVTLDFEGVNASDRPGLTTFVQDLAAALHARGKELAVAVPASTGDLSSGWAGAYDDRAIGQVADWVVVMAYGYRTKSSSQPGPIAPLPWFTSVSTYVASVVPLQKLIVGIGVWGYDWNLAQTSPATTLRYSDVVDLMQRQPGRLTYDTAAASATFAYQVNGVAHRVWFENSTGLEQKVVAASSEHVAGVAFWRLGQEPPGLWDALKTLGPTDFAIPNGWFFGETSGEFGLGYRVTDNGGVRFWTEFRRLGGVETLGYPASRRYIGSDGFTYQAFQRGLLQWRPELGVAYLANTFDQLSTAGQDGHLVNLGIPLPISNDGSGGDWNRARQIRLDWLTNPVIRAAYLANPNPTVIRKWNVDQSIQLYGLPTSLPEQSGPFIVQRFQRVSLQLWTDNVPGMPAMGTVVGILGGDLLKQAGLVPPEAAAPEAPN